MNEQAAKTRQEIKQNLNGGSYLTFLDLFLDIPGRVIRKRTISFYWSAAIICGIILVIGYGLSALQGEMEPSNLRTIKTEFLGIALAYLSLVIFKNARNAVIGKIRNDIVDQIEELNNLKDLEKWLRLFSNAKMHLVFCLIYAIGFSFGLKTEFVGFGSAFVVFSVAFIWGIPMYFLLTFVLLPYRLGKYEFHLYRPDPSNSKIIFDLSRLFQGLVYLYAIVASGSMIFIAYSGLLASLALPSLFVAWLPIIALFILNQYALSSIIVKGKRKTLSEIQIQVEDIQKNQDMAEKETMDKVVRLMDYHDRVQATKNGAFDLRAGLDFINSLLLPVVGFFVGKIDLDTIEEIFDTITSRLTPR